MTTKAEMQAEIERLKTEKAALQEQVKDLKRDVEGEKRDRDQLIAQGNALLGLLDEILQIKVHSVGHSKPIMWGFFDKVTGQELHRNESLAEGYRYIWNIDERER